MTQSNTIVAKASVAFVAIAMSLMMIAPAKAATAEEMQAQIDALMATIKSLQTSMSATPAATPTGAAYVFTRSLTIGSQGADVTALQTYLIAAGHPIAAGATGYFGAQTAAAVAAWQTKNGISPAAGYFGPVSQAKYAALMAATPTTPDDEDDTTSADLTGEASLSTTDLKDGDDTSIEEGQEAAPVAELELEFADGDAQVSRIDVSLVDTGSEEDPWDTFEEVSLIVDGDEVGTIDVSDEDNWLDADLGTLRFSGLDFVAMEDETVTVEIAVTVQSSVDNMPATWNVDALNVRYTDADDVTTTDTITETAVDFEIRAAGSDDEVIVKSSTEDVDATTLELDSADKSDFTTVFAFDLDTDDSTNDIEVDTIVVDVASTEDGTVSTTTDLLINDAQLVIDGETFDDVAITVSGSKFTFDIDKDLVIDAGERVTVEFQAEFKALASYLEGATVQASITGSTGVVSEGADDITASGASTGDEHTLRTSGAILEAGAMTGVKDANTDTAGDEEGVFTLKFDVTAFNDDLFIAKSAASTTGSGSGAGYKVTNGSGTGVGTSTTQSASLASTASSETGTDSVSRFVVKEGETETFTLTVNYNPNNVGAFYGIQLYSLNFKTANTAAATVVQQLASPAENYETDPLAI